MGVVIPESGFDTLTFDCYGTLIDWQGGIGEAFRVEAERQGGSVDIGAILQAHAEIEPQEQAGPYRSYRDVLRQTAWKIGARLGLTIPPDRIRFLEDHLQSWSPFPDTNTALERLRKKYHLGILSNIDDDLLAATLKHFSVTFDWTVTAEQVRSYKPATAHFEKAIERAGGKDKILHVAASRFHDVGPAKQLGIPVIWVNRKGETPDDSGPEPDHVVSNLLELADTLVA